MQYFIIISLISCHGLVVDLYMYIVYFVVYILTSIFLFIIMAHIRLHRLPVVNKYHLSIYIDFNVNYCYDFNIKLHFNIQL